MNSTRRNFLKRSGAASLGIGFLSIPQFGNFWHDDVYDLLERKSPESQGVSSAAVSRFLNAANASGLNWHSFMLLRHGNVVAEGSWKPFDRSYKHTLYSLSKSFTSTAIGLLVKEGKLSIEDPVISFFPDELPSMISDNLRQMKLKHMLTMNTGHAEDTTPKMRAGTDTWTKTFLSLPVEHTPGTYFLYNTGATYMLSAIVHKVSGEDLEKYLTPRLFQPLDITDFDWEKSPQGLSVAGWGLRLKPEDVAKFGQMYLQKGKWNGKEILTESWVHDASSRQTNSNPGDSDWSQGYGYLFWRCKPGFFRGDGAFGQFCVVMPQHDAVMVVNSESWDMQKQMTIMWENILPGLHDTPLTENAADLQQLKKDISSLSLPVVKGNAQSPLAKKYNNVIFKVDGNEFGIGELQFRFTSNGCAVIIKSAGETQTIEAGWEHWKISNESLPYVFAIPNRNPVPSKVAASATWVNENTLQMDLKFVEAIHGDKITAQFDGNKVSIKLFNSVSENTKNNPEKRGTLLGNIV